MSPPKEISSVTPIQEWLLSGMKAKTGKQLQVLVQADSTGSHPGGKLVFRLFRRTLIVSSRLVPESSQDGRPCFFAAAYGNILRKDLRLRTLIFLPYQNKEVLIWLQLMGEIGLLSSLRVQVMRVPDPLLPELIPLKENIVTEQIAMVENRLGLVVAEPGLVFTSEASSLYMNDLPSLKERLP